MEFEFTRKNFKQFDKKPGIYLIRIAHHIYIGSAKNLRNRLNQHCWSLKTGKHHNRTLQNCYNKYTVSQVTFEILEECAVEDLLIREAFYITEKNADMNHIKDPTNVSMDDISRMRLKSSLKDHYKTHESLSNKKVYQYSLQGEYLGEFKSVAEASRRLNICNSGICNVCRDLKGTAGKYQWRYEKYEQIDPYKSKNGIKPIHQIDVETGETIKIWKTQSEIQKELGFDRKLIGAACESGEPFKGFLWKKGESKKDLKKKQPKFIPGVPVYQYDLKGNYIQRFNSAQEAERMIGVNGTTICRSMIPNTPNRSAGGFLWSTEKVDKMPEYQNFSDKSKIKSIWLFDVLTGQEFEYESIAEAIRELDPNTTNFDSSCAALSSSAINGGFFKHYLAKNEDTEYKLTVRNTKIYNSQTGEIYNNAKDASTKTGYTTWMLKKWASDDDNEEWYYLNDCARVKLRESGKTFS